jgi:hypothetical protein
VSDTVLAILAGAVVGALASLPAVLSALYHYRWMRDWCRDDREIDAKWHDIYLERLAIVDDCLAALHERVAKLEGKR